MEKDKGGDRMNKLKEQKEQALEIYKEAKKTYLENMSQENWKAFCEAQRNCMLLGVRI